MTENDTNPSQQFLPVAAAAERLGVSRLKVREAAARNLIPSRRDNENKLRLDLSGTPLPDLSEIGIRSDVPPAMLMDVLFDELEELHAELAGAAVERSALRDLADRQAEALDRALSAGEALEAKIAERDRTIACRNATVEQVLEVSERAVTLAAGAKPPARKGFWRRLFGL